MAFNAAILSAEINLPQLAEKAGERKQGGLNYAGEIFPQEAFEYIKNQPAIIVDVRTSQEWQSVGIPDIANTQGQLITLSWKFAPSYALNPDFVNELSANDSVDKETPLFFLCRSGGRSLDAAIAMTNAGYRNCFNVTRGFEGDGNENISKGWKQDNLPWVKG